MYIIQLLNPIFNASQNIQVSRMWIEILHSINEWLLVNKHYINHSTCSSMVIRFSITDLTFQPRFLLMGESGYSLDFEVEGSHLKVGVYKFAEVCAVLLE